MKEYAKFVCVLYSDIFILKVKRFFYKSEMKEIEFENENILNVERLENMNNN